MDFETLPGPSLPELARTAVARAATAAVSYASLVGDPVTASEIPVRSGPAGSPVLLTATGSALARQLGTGPETVSVSVAAAAPFAGLRLTGTAQPAAPNRKAGIIAYVVAVRSVEFCGTVSALVSLDQYQAATPDPLWREAPGILRHLEQGHMSDLIGCVRAHGMLQADWVIPRGLDRYGLELLVLTADGTAATRLSFPSGPVTSLRDVPASVRTVLTCRCQSAPEHHDGRARST
jgi:hypothetical protein